MAFPGHLLCMAIKKVVLNFSEITVALYYTVTYHLDAAAYFILCRYETLTDCKKVTLNEIIARIMIELRKQSTRTV